jgi:hypothetical protein
MATGKAAVADNLMHGSGHACVQQLPIRIVDLVELLLGLEPASHSCGDEASRGRVGLSSLQLDSVFCSGVKMATPPTAPRRALRALCIIVVKR